MRQVICNARALVLNLGGEFLCVARGDVHVDAQRLAGRGERPAVRALERHEGREAIDDVLHRIEELDEAGLDVEEVLLEAGERLLRHDLEADRGPDRPSDPGRAEAFAMDDILLFGLMANAKNPAEWEVVGDSLQVEPYACMLRKDDPKFKALVDGVITGMMKSGEFDRLYKKWFMSPIPPKNINLNLPMSAQLRDSLKAPSDKPAL